MSATGGGGKVCLLLLEESVLDPAPAGPDTAPVGAIVCHGVTAGPARARTEGTAASLAASLSGHMHVPDCQSWAFQIPAWTLPVLPPTPVKSRDALKIRDVIKNL